MVAEVNFHSKRHWALAIGWFGVDRLKWANDQFEAKLNDAIQLAKNPANAIEEINICVFGFSRGAALARAFIHDFVRDRCKYTQGEKFGTYRKGGYRVRIRFMGLFDTVASVGAPMGGNNMRIADAKYGNYRTHKEKRFSIWKDTVPTMLAFAEKAAPGADPAPGVSNGHMDWGDRMMIPDVVENVRHFVAAHEVRNSFPLDSIQVLEDDGKWRKRENFFEYVYAGVHSDVGGSYRPGEGGKNEDSNTKLGLIPLRAMFDFAESSSVPFLPQCAWREENVNDFKMERKVRDEYNFYLAQIKASPITLGNLFNDHMRLYYEWRFYLINKKMKANGDKENIRIKMSGEVFKADRVKLQTQITAADKISSDANAALKRAISQRESVRNGYYGTSGKPLSTAAMEKNIIDLRQAAELAKDDSLKLHAQMSCLPNMDELPTMADWYDQQLYADAKAIYDILLSPRANSIARRFDTVSDTLRPHYKVLIQAYHNEFKTPNGGLRNERIISFFEEYIHDSVAGFGADATLRSDPRVIYVGGDTKFPYADVHPIIDGNSRTAVA